MKEQYDELKGYVESIDERPLNKYYERPFMLDLIGDVTSKKILDAGCGTGFFAINAFDNGASVVASDVSEKMLSHVKYLRPEINTVKLDFEEGIKLDEKFDLIISSLVLHYINDWNKFVDDAFEKLNEGGRLIISTHHPVQDFHKNQDLPYLKKHLINAKWSATEKNNEEIEVSYYIRPLSEVLAYINNKGYSKVNIYEPFPKEEFKDALGHRYDRLINKACFLFIELVK